MIIFYVTPTLRLSLLFLLVLAMALTSTERSKHRRSSSLTGLVLKWGKHGEGKLSKPSCHAFPVSRDNETLPTLGSGAKGTEMWSKATRNDSIYSQLDHFHPVCFPEPLPPRTALHNTQKT